MRTSDSSGKESRSDGLERRPTLSRGDSRASGSAGARPRSAIVLAAVGFIALLVCLLILGVIADDVREQEAIALDAIATPLLHSYASPLLDTLMQTFTDLGSTLVVLPLLIGAVALLLWRHHRREALFLVAAMAGSVVLNQGLKLFFQRPRPQLSWSHVIPEYSFPSGHAMNSFVLYVTLALIVWVVLGKRAGLLAVTTALVLTLCIGTSRIYLGYHYLTDVVAGYVAGAAWLLIVSAAFDGGLWLHRWRSEVRPA